MRVLLALEEHGSFSAAADALDHAQSAVSDARGRATDAFLVLLEHCAAAHPNLERPARG